MEKKVLIQQTVAQNLGIEPQESANRYELGEQCDMVIVVGGDGSLLNAGRVLCNYDIPILGINRGHLGFLTDIRPSEMEETVKAILKGDYTEERRYILHAVPERLLK